MSNQQGRPPGDELTFQASANLAGLLWHSHATCFSPFLRWGFGSEALGFNGLGALVLMFVVCGLAEEPRLIPFATWWIVAMVVQRMKTMWDGFRGKVVHSRFGGVPLLCVLCFGNWRFAKLVLEPLLCSGIGLSFKHVSEPFCNFFLIGAASLIAVQCMEIRMERVRLRQMQDAQLEAEYMAALQRRQS